MKSSMRPFRPATDEPSRRSRAAARRCRRAPFGDARLSGERRAVEQQVDDRVLVARLHARTDSGVLARDPRRPERFDLRGRLRPQVGRTTAAAAPGRSAARPRMECSPCLPAPGHCDARAGDEHRDDQGSGIRDEGWEFTRFIALDPHPESARARNSLRWLGWMRGPYYLPVLSVNNDDAFVDRRSAAGMVMRGGKPVQRMPVAKLLGASMGFPEPHGHVGRQHRRCVT